VRGCDLEVSAADGSAGDGGADDGGSWTRLPTDTQAGGYVYAAAPGQEVRFRLWATDRVNNASGWVEGSTRTVAAPSRAQARLVS
jgi:hypothetical protein